MLKFLSRIFRSKVDPDLSNFEIDEINSYAEVKKNKLTNNSYIEERFYIHDELNLTIDKENEMSAQTLEQQHVESTVQIVDERTGNMVSVDASQAARQLEQVPPGITIQGIGTVGGPNHRPQQQQRPPQQQQFRPQQQQQQQQQQFRPQQQQQQQQQQQFQPQQQPPQQIQVQQAVPKFPNVEVATLSGSYHLFMDLAGVTKNTLGITFSNGFLTITGKRESNIDKLKKSLKGNTKNRKNPILKKVETVPKFLMGSFVFEYPFEKMVDESAIEALLEDGILHVTLPHRTKGEAVKVSIG